MRSVGGSVVFDACEVYPQWNPRHFEMNSFFNVFDMHVTYTSEQAICVPQWNHMALKTIVYYVTSPTR